VRPLAAPPDALLHQTFRRRASLLVFSTLSPAELQQAARSAAPEPPRHGALSRCHSRRLGTAALRRDRLGSQFAHSRDIRGTVARPPVRLFAIGCSGMPSTRSSVRLRSSSPSTAAAPSSIVGHLASSLSTAAAPPRRSTVSPRGNHPAPAAAERPRTTTESLGVANLSPYLDHTFSIKRLDETQGVDGI